MSASTQFTVEQLHRVFDTALHMCATDDGGLAVRSLTATADVITTYIQPLILAGIHPDLPPAFTNILEYCKRLYDDSLYADEVASRLLAQLRHLTNPCRLPRVDNTPVWMRQIESVIWNGTTFNVSGIAYQLTDKLPESCWHPEQPTTAYVNQVYMIAVDVPLYWLDEQYPGWRDRYAVSEALGQTKTERAAYVLPEKRDAAAVPVMGLGLPGDVAC